MKKLTAFLVLALFVSASILEAREAILSGFKGKVEVQKKFSLAWDAAKPKMHLKDGDKIRTGSRSEAILIFEDGSKTTIYAKTTLNLAQLAAPVNLQLTQGKARNRVQRGGRGFTMRTPTAVCSVRGTDFTVGIEMSGETKVDVFEGVVNGLKTLTGESVDVKAGQTLIVTPDAAPLAAPQALETPERQETELKALAKKEVGLDMTREQIQAAAAEEMKLAEYQEGKSMIDVNGFRVRIEEYILRKPKDVAEADREKAFKFVVLNTRENRFDYFTYKGIFNKTLPDDLSVALQNVSGRKFGEAPEYYLTAYEMAQSNLTDAIKDMADGGHLVKIVLSNGVYTLQAYDANGNLSNSVTMNAEANGQAYDPVADVYKDPGASKDGVFDPVTDQLKTMQTGDTLWRTVFNRYAHLMGPGKDLSSLTLGNIPTGTLAEPWFQVYQPAGGISNIATLCSINNAVLATDGTLSVRGKSLTLYRDQTIGHASYRYLNGHYAFDAYFPDASNPDAPGLDDVFHQRLVTYYPKNNSDIPYEQYDTYIISDAGKTAAIKNFANATSGSAFKAELIKWNYEQITRSSAYENRTIDLVCEPKILIRSGLIK